MLQPIPEHIMLEMSPEEARILQTVLNHHLKYFGKEPAYKNISRCLRRIQMAMMVACTVDNVASEGD